MKLVVVLALVVAAVAVPRPMPRPGADPEADPALLYTYPTFYSAPYSFYNTLGYPSFYSGFYPYTYSLVVRPAAAPAATAA
ncbi:uncharacterized protein [Cherax quadricarinatus]|uniref:uncharacterized protein n=1 Tax=Cherax quadricarinatus TaxID=27406 RepID=UPI00387E87A1